MTGRNFTGLCAIGFGIFFIVNNGYLFGIIFIVLGILISNSGRASGGGGYRGGDGGGYGGGDGGGGDGGG